MPPGLYVGLSSGNVGIGTTGIAGTSNLVNVSGKDVYIGANTRYASYTSYASNVSVPSADGRINGVSITALNKRTRTSYASAADCVRTWTARTSPADNEWVSVCWAPEVSIFVAVAVSGVGNRVMTSPDGVTWTAQTSAANNQWRSVCWAPELSLFVAVADSGTGNRVMTSTNGITWTTRTSAADNDWWSICWSPVLSLFVVVAVSGAGNRVMTSSNGIAWTVQTSAANNSWRSVCWAPELSLFVAVAPDGTGNRVMTSSDGITWTARASAANNFWRSVCWAPELSLLVAVAESGVGNRVMTSPDGINWTARVPAADNLWLCVCWAPELSLFVSVAADGTGNRVMTSPDGITWTARTSANENQWWGVCWSPELSIFVGVAAYTGSGNRVMTSAIGMPNSKSVVKALPSQMMVDANGNVGIGTTNPFAKLHLTGSYPIRMSTTNQTFDIGVNNSDRAFYVSSLSGYYGVYLIHNTTGGWAGYSDMRIKKNIEPIQNILSKVLQLNPVMYHMKDENEQVTDKHYGLIAQDVELVFPNIVQTTAGTDEIPNIKGLTYTTFIPIILQCIKEQQSQIDYLKEKILTLT